MIVKNDMQRNGKSHCHTFNGRMFQEWEALNCKGCLAERCFQCLLLFLIWLIHPQRFSERWIWEMSEVKNFDLTSIVKLNKIFPEQKTISRKSVTVVEAFGFIIQDLKSLFIYRFHKLYYCVSYKPGSGFATNGRVHTIMKRDTYLLI